MKGILLLAAVHLLIIYQSQKKKGVKKDPVSRESRYLVQQKSLAAPAIILTKEFEKVPDKNSGNVSFLFNISRF